ncbi:TspO and MBR related proteins [Chitinophaga costaii]|uniref:TspO and MBR related proteins n=1 Tax=Chitinophaga costaii TaxID=1335309 RepID=A0A1C4FCL6_9BACT|nr:hypothetical protein [Chitinophaga costaii]SCC53738.1 TspO and MBR related proteins [Chitinophaga costaii]
MMSPAQSSYHQKNLSVFNLLAFVIVLVLNTMAASGRINGRTPAMISQQYPSLFTPAAFTFAIWSVIYLGLLSFCIYQCWLAFQSGRDAARNHMATRLQTWWLWSCMANAGWLIAWHYNWLPLSIVVMGFLWYSIWNIQQRFQVASPDAPLPIKLFVFIPFGLYFGWISIAFIANLLELVAYFDIPVAGTGPMLFAIAGLLLGTALTAYFLLLHNNVPYALVTIWAFIGIIAKRQNEGLQWGVPIIQTCFILAGLVAVAIIWQLFRQRHWKTLTAHGLADRNFL